MAVVLIGTLDTKGHEVAFVRDLFQAQHLETIVIDVGSSKPPRFEPEIGREAVFLRASTPARNVEDRGEAVTRAAEGVAEVVSDLHRSGKVDGIFGLGGSAGTVIGTSAMRALPFGIPKVMVSTLASGQTRPYVGGSDIAMFHPVLDIAGLNRLTKVALSNAAHALIGMLKAPRSTAKLHSSGPVIAATMFGVTTPCVDRARASLEARGREVLVFHATGIGGRAMEGLIRDGLIDAVLDLTTTELADEEVGGILSAGPDRLKAAIDRGLPQVVSVGALDMVNFGPRDSVPGRFAGRCSYQHNPSVTLMRTTPEENAAIGARMASILAQAKVPTVVLLPLAGISALDKVGGPFHDPEANAALFLALHSILDDHPLVTVVDRHSHINDPEFADQAAFILEVLMSDDPTPEIQRP